MRLLFVAMGIVGCSRETAAPVVEAPVEAPPAPEPPPVEEAGAELGDLLGDQAGEAKGFEGLGMRGEGVQNGGPKYPGIGDIGTGGLPGYGTMPSGRYGQVNLHLETPSIRGPRTRAELEPVLGQVSVHLRSCYARAWRGDPALNGGGTVTLRWRLGPDGVADVTVVGTSAADRAVGACAAEQIRALSWPASETPTTVTWPLRFAPAW